MIQRTYVFVKKKKKKLYQQQAVEAFRNEMLSIPNFLDNGHVALHYNVTSRRVIADGASGHRVRGAVAKQNVRFGNFLGWVTKK
jgi:hypothetical protein